MKKTIKVTLAVLVTPIVALVIINTITTRSLKSEIVIDAPADEVWKVLMNHAAYPEWNPFIKKISGSIQPGDYLETTLQTEGNDPMDFKPIVLKNQFSQEFRWKGKLGIKGIFDGEHYFILEETTPNQTRFIQGENFTGLLSGLLMKMIGEDTKGGFILMNEALKTRVEAQQLKAQTYSGTIHYGESTIDYQVKLTKAEDQTKAFFTSIDMSAYEIPCQNTTLKKDTLEFYVISDYYTYAYQYINQNENFKGNLKIYSNETEQLLNSFETNLSKTNPNKQDKIEKRDFTFGSNGLQLYGTLWKPQKPIGKGLFFVTSSQGNDRSGTNAEAYYFANLGYTVFHYDKRGTGKSEGDWQSANIEELCSDDMNAIEFFLKISALPISEIGIKGSSQGGIKIPYLLSKLPDLEFGISISCPGGTLLESDLNHWKNLNINQIGEKNINQALKIQEAGYNYLAGNISYEFLAQLKNENSKEDWLKYVWIPERDVQKDYKLNFSGLPFFKEITQPVLVIQGLSDNVIPGNSYKTIEKVIGKSKSTNYQIITLENTSHSMTWLNEDFPYFQILSPEYLPLVSDWLKKI